MIEAILKGGYTEFLDGLGEKRKGIFCFAFLDNCQTYLFVGYDFEFTMNCLTAKTWYVGYEAG